MEGPATTTINASVTKATTDPTIAERQPRDAPSARTIVAASTISTAEAKATVTKSATTC
jgi:hypothetical protein